MGKLERPPAIVMNMFYTGLGIARSLGEHGIPVIGLTSQPGIYGNFTRYAKTMFCPDSRLEPDALFTWMVKLGQDQDIRSVVFPTRDDDALFLDRFRRELEPYFELMIPESAALRKCLSKWDTYLCAQQAAVTTPQCWLIEEKRDIARIAEEVTFPCVLKPVTSRDWRIGGNWEIVGARKAIGISSREELLAAYKDIARADERALVQEMVRGGDDRLLIAACYLDRNSQWVAGFNTQKLVQSPEGFGTGCVVQTVERPELFAPAMKVLQAMGFTGIAEVEFKWDESRAEYQLIEINPRPWDQHRLGKACGADLVVIAYCDHTGLPTPARPPQRMPQKWIAEDTFCMTALRLAWNRDPKFLTLFRMARGRRIYAVWSARDPLPSLAYWVARFIPEMIRMGAQVLWSAIKRKLSGKAPLQEGLRYEKDFENGKSSS